MRIDDRCQQSVRLCTLGHLDLHSSNLARIVFQFEPHAPATQVKLDKSRQIVASEAADARMHGSGKSNHGWPFSGDAVRFLQKPRMHAGKPSVSTSLRRE